MIESIDKPKALVILILFMLLSAFPIVASDSVAADQEGDYEYSVSDGEATITGYSGLGGAIKIPDTMGGYPVVAIGSSAFQGIIPLTSVTLPAGVTTVGESAFSNCSSLTAIVFLGFTAPTEVGDDWIADTDPSIRGHAYFASNLPAPGGSFHGLVMSDRIPYYWYSYTVSDGKATITDYTGPGGTITIPSALGGYPVVAIGDWALETVGDDIGLQIANGLISVTIPNSVTTIGTGSFYGNPELVSVTIPNSVNYIGSSAFAGGDVFPGSGLSSIVIPDSVTYLGGAAFSYCSSLTSATLGKGITSIGSGTFAFCTSLTTVNIPDAVTQIGTGAFAHCSSLTSVTIPASVTAIEGGPFTSPGWPDGAFYGCSSLTSMTFLGLVAPTSVGENWIAETPSTLRGHAYFNSNFPAPGQVWNGLTMGSAMATVPGAPTGLTATPGDTNVTLNWTAPSSNGGSAITGYRVYRGTSSGTLSVLTMMSNVLTYSDPNLTNGQRYYYRVTAVNTVGEGPRSGEASAIPVGLPSAPRNLVAEPGNGTINLSWAAPSSNGGSAITGYRVYQGTAPGGEMLLATIGNVLTYTHAGLTNGLTYYYKVSASNGVGEGEQSVEASATPATVPSAPESLVAVASPGEVSLAWQTPESNGGSDITGYEVYRATIPGGQGAVLIGTTNATTRTYVDTSVEADTYYYYTVKAVNAMGRSIASNEESTFSAAAQVPSAPGNLTASASDGYVILTWSASASIGSSNITGYDIFRGDSADAVTAKIGSTNATTLSYNDSAVTNGVTYFYAVKALNDEGSSPSSDIVNATPFTPSVPDAPRNLSTASGDGFVLLTWEAPISPGSSAITGYVVYRSGSSGGDGASIGSVPAGNLTFNDTTVINGANYYYSVTAINAIGPSPASNQAVGAPSQAGSAPSAPLGLTAAGQVGGILLTWNAPSSTGSGVADYQIFRAESPGGHGATPLDSVPGGTLSYLDEAAVPGTEYYYIVKANNSYGTSAPSNEDSAMAAEVPGGVPSSPRDLNATAGEGQVSLTWSAPSEPGSSPITSYKVYRRAAEGPFSFIANVTGTDYLDSSLGEGQTYYFKVSAVNSAGEGNATEEVAVTLAGTPSSPLGLALTAEAGKVTLTWQAPAYDGGSAITGYNVYRKAGDGPFDLLIAVASGFTTYVDATGAAGTTYSYYVTAVNAAGEGENSTLASAMLPSDDTLVYVGAGVVGVSAVAALAYYLVRRKK
jgi:titin